MVAGMVAPTLLVVVVVVLTLHQRSFLESAGWSPVGRTPVQWPSLLTLGPGGWLLVAAFVCCGILGVIFSTALYWLTPTRLARTGAILLALMSVAVALQAFRPDSPGSAESSWHDTVHNGAYPFIPIFALTAAASFAAGLRAVQGRRSVAAISLGICVVIGVAGGLSRVDSIAQLARYFLFGAILLWVEFLAATAYRMLPLPKGG
jgi:Protein of unknown function (DUF998)